MTIFKRRHFALFAVLLFLFLIVTMPLSLVLPLTGLTQAGLSTRAASGTIWSGSLSEARIGRLSLGDVTTALAPLPLFLGRARVSMTSMLGQGSLSTASDGFRLDDATARLATPRVFAPIPLSAIDLTAVTVHFEAHKCVKAQGRVRATFLGDVGGLSLAQGLSGEVRCEGAALLLPLMSQSLMERLNIYLQDDGRYRAAFIIRATDPAMAEKLRATGFMPGAGGFVFRLAGKL